MKLMIASDIHGSALYCEEMLRLYQKEEADKLLLLGDLLYHGPRNELPDGYQPKKVIELLNRVAEELLCVRGNCDAEVDQMVLHFPIMADYMILYVENRMIYVSHGHIHNERTLLPVKKGDILLNGHTHIAKIEEKEGYLFLNPGSISLPKEQGEHTYMIYENKCFEIKNLEGNVLKSYYI